MDEYDLHRLHAEAQKFDRQARYLIAWAESRDQRGALARAIQRQVSDRLDQLGYVVTSTTHKAHYDLLCNGVRIEVKGSRWDGRRYQANLRDNDADVLVFGCLDGVLHSFVIPFERVRGKTVIKITQHDPRDCIGQFLPFYEAWDVIDDLIRAGRNAWQPALMEVR